MRTILATLGFALSLSAGPIYDVTNLGNLGGRSARGFSINNAGAVAGGGTTLSGNSFAAVWDGVDAALLLGVGASADAINLFGAVAGTTTVDGVQRATVWQNGEVQHLSDGDSSAGLGINDAGDIAGSLVRGNRASAFVKRAGRLIEIAPGIWSSAYDINNSGEVTGYYQDGIGFRAFTWNEADGLRTLRTLGGRNGYGMALNDSGVVVGSSSTGSGYLHAFLYDGTMRDLGTLGGHLSAAYGVNGDGHAVGFSYDAQGRQRAFVWHGGTMFDLNELIDPASGWTLESAYGINDLGQIVGQGLYGGARVAFSLNPFAPADDPFPRGVDTPEPGTAALLLASFAMLAAGQVIRRRRE